MKKTNFFKRNAFKLIFAFAFLLVFTQACDEKENSDPEVLENLEITGPEDGLAIYINGKDTKKETPASISLEEGVYNVSIFSETTKKLYAKTANVTENEVTKIDITTSDLAKREWKILVVGFKSVTDGVDTYTYTDANVNAISAMVLSELKALQAFSYGIVNWTKDVKMIEKTVELDLGYITPAVFNAEITDINPGDYDLIVATYQDGFEWGNWSSPEADINSLTAKASFISMPFAYASDDHLQAWVDDIIANPHTFLSNAYLRTLTQSFYPSLGVIVPPDKDAQDVVMWRAEQYGYDAGPDNNWASWYEDIMKGKVDGKYGIGPQALYGMSPRAYALNEIGY